MGRVTALRLLSVAFYVREGVRHMSEDGDIIAVRL